MREAGVVLLVMAGVSPLMAQRPGRQAARAGSDTTTGRPCLMQVDNITRFYQAGGGAMFGGGGVAVHCTNQPTTMTADSLAWYASISELHLLGRVHVRDSISYLESDQATYWVKQERIYATGHVLTRNLQNGSSLRGPNIDYYRILPGVRDTVEMRATGRPVINFFRSHDSTAVAADTATPFVIVGDRVRMKGNDRMWGAGHVTIDRQALTAAADSSSLDLTAEHGELVGHPSVADTSKNAYHLTGQRISFDLNDNNDIRRVVAKDSADATGPDWFLSGDTLDMKIDSGKVQRAQAWGRHRRSTAISDRNTITADSLDINMPRGVVTLVWGYGNGRAVSRPDTTSPDSEPDWMVGDTLRARFAQHPADTLRPDTAHMRTDIEHVTAFGRARAYYHTDNEQDRGGQRGISYARGRRIEIAVNSSKVRTVDVVGQVDGIYLEPFTRAQRDSAHRDTVRQDSIRHANGLPPLGDSASVRQAPPASAPNPPAPRPATDTTVAPVRPLPGRRP